MKTVFVNNATKEEKTIFDLFINEDGNVQSVEPRGARFIEKHSDTLTEVAKADDGSNIFTVNAGWSIVNGTRRRGTKAEPKAAPKATAAPKTKKADDTPKTAPKATTKPANDEPKAAAPVVNDTKAAPKAEPKATKDTPKAEPTNNDDTNTLVGEDEVALLLALKRMRGSSVDEKAVEAIVERVLEKYASQPAASAKVQTAAKAIKAANKAKGAKVYHCKDYDDIKRDVEDGFYPYLCGAAGCGKSHTAEQIANDLGLELYCQTTIQFAHDVKGYGTADGRLVETPFYKAFAFGGLYFQDEYDRSFTEAAVVLNTAVAQLYYDFPVVGRVYAHPNFRFMAAGNTRMKGADTQYTAAQPIDISSVDRVVFYECEYNHDVELNAIAKGDKELVAFVEDARKAIASTGVEHVLSYRATKYMKAREDKKEAALKRATFKALEVDEIRLIYGALKNKENVWAKSMANII